jgi:mRNA interferase RelE/StbE
LNLIFKASFIKDLKRIKEQGLKTKVREVIDLVERARSLQDINAIKKLKGSDRYYRIRISDYRIGLSIEEETVTFVRFLHRKDIYRYFP